MKNHCTIAFTSIALVLCLLFGTVTAYGANSDYLNESKWVRAAGVKTVELNKTSINNHISGTASYINDNDILTMYNFFSFSESSLQYDGNDDVRVLYEVNAKEGLYTFTVTENGIDDEYGESQNVFDVGYNFYIDGKTCKSLTYAQYKGESTSINVRVFLFINNCRYMVLDSVALKIPEKTTVKKQTTKKAAKTTKKKKTTTRKSKKSSKKVSAYVSKSGRASATERSTKFDMHFDDEPQTNSNGKSKAETTANAGEEESLLAQSKAMSNRARIMLACGIALIVIGALVIIYTVGYSRAAKRFKSDSTEDKTEESD